jgi:lipoate-protein ligase A
MNPIRLLNLGIIPAIQTQAIYHALAERMNDNSQDTIILCRPLEPYLCLGFHQVFENVFDPIECEKRKLPVLRRRLGGGATYLDNNQIFYQCIFHHTHLPPMVKDIFAATLAAPLKVLRDAGLNAELRDTNEIEVGTKRIAGTGGGRIGEATVVVGNLLFDFDFEAMAAVWHTPSGAFRSLAQKALRECIVNLKELPVSLSLETISESLIKCFSSSMGRPLEPDRLSYDEILSIEIMGVKLAGVEYLALHKNNPQPEPMRSLKISARANIRFDEFSYNQSIIRGSFWLMDGLIHEVTLESTPQRKWESFEQQLRGSLFNEWTNRLMEINKAVVAKN